MEGDQQLPAVRQSPTCEPDLQQTCGDVQAEPPEPQTQVYEAHMLPVGTDRHWVSVQQLPVRHVAEQQTPVPLVHVAPSGRLASAGQVTDVPLQTSAASHPPEPEGRQTVPTGA
jgi:hypothetical protein